ncbi:MULTISPECIES: hypothetical protein [unclassified Pseudomonas]|uniref:hypothetical protein n=1 Tax=unclassified Pseudomonas TaxID=196821 RepID=UPI0011B66248|nr:MULTISPECIES: hypothetical protein [unclassified Pseudomonas]
MGIHQLKLQVVPKSFIDNPPRKFVPAIELQEGIEPWKVSPPPSEGFLLALRKMLPIEKSWGETEEYVSGGNWQSKIRIWWTEGQLESIEFNFSPVANEWALMRYFLKIVRQEDLLLIDSQSGHVLQPDDEIVKVHFGQSRSSRFLVSPEEVILAASEPKLPPGAL